MTTLKVVFDNPTNVYFAGQLVTGNVVLVLKDSMKLRKIHLALKGKANVNWTTTYGKTRRHHHIYDNYFDDTVILLGTDDKGSEITLQPGSHQYPFRYNLPAKVPTSFEGANGYVRYFATATVDRPWKTDTVSYAGFTVINHLNLNTEPAELKGPIQSEDEKTASSCLTSGSVLARFGLNRRCFVPGEAIVCNSRVENRTNRKMNWMSIFLQQKVEFRCNRTIGGPIVRVRLVGKTATNNTPIPPGESVEWNNVAIAIPPIVPSRLDGCDILNVEYFIEFQTHHGVKITHEVVIGTVPLSGTAAAAQTQPSYEPCIHSYVPVGYSLTEKWAPSYPNYEQRT